MFRIFAPLALLVAIVVCVVGFDNKEPRADFVFVNRGDVFTLDPQRMSWLTDMQAAYCLFEGVVRWDTSDFSIEPACAESYSVSDDGLTYMFYLREDARWSNGAKVTAHDFQYSWMRLLTPDTSSDYSNFFFTVSGAREFWDWRTKLLKNRNVVSIEELEQRFKEVVGIQVLDDHTISVTLVHQVPYFLDQLALAVCSPVYKPTVEGWDTGGEEYLSALSRGWSGVTPPPMSERRWVEIDKESGRIMQQYFWARPGLLVGNGPFVLDLWRYKRDMKFVRNPYYHSPEITSLDSIHAITITDPNTAVLTFEGGELDWLSSVNVDYQPDMLAQKKVGVRNNIHTFPAFGTDFFSFNCRPLLNNGNKNPFNNPAVRRAFVYATNRDEIVAFATRLHEPVVSSIVPPNSIVGYGSVDGLGFNPALAKEELAKAGWEDRNGDGKVEDVSGNPFPTIDLLYTTNTPRYKWIALELRDQWAKHLGVSVALRGTDNKFFSSDLHSGNFMVARGRWYGDYGDPTTFLDIFKTENGNNDRGFSNPEIDAALEKAANELNPTRRLDMLRNIEEQLFTEDVPMLVICQLLQLYMYDPEKIHGLTSHPRLVQHLWRVSKSD